MIKALISDFSRVLLFPKDKDYKDGLNGLHRELSKNPDYKLMNYFEVNNELLKFYESLKGKLNLYIFTSETIQDSPELEPYLKPIFEGIFSALKMGINKKEELAYKSVASEINLRTEEVIYIDDSLVNIEPAKQAGLQTILYENNDDTIFRIQELLKK